MKDKLKNYFPLICEREELLLEIKENPKLREIYEEWSTENRKEFLDFCTGVKGMKILYDSFFKEVMNAEYTPERLEKLLCVLLKRQVKIVRILPNDSTRIADETSLLITDIVVELEDGSLANVEIQKIGYAFPGPRSACYSADMLLRQYKRIRAKQGEDFSYNNIKNVYLIVIYESSPKEFKAMYETLYLMCQNTERVMGMFSEELRELDKNTVKYMIEEQQREIDIQKEELKRKDEELNKKDIQFNQMKEQMNKQLNKQAEEISWLKEKLEQLCEKK